MMVIAMMLMMMLLMMMMMMMVMVVMNTHLSPAWMILVDTIEIHSRAKVTPQNQLEYTARTLG